MTEETRRSRRADDPWQRGEPDRWTLAREVEWIGAQTSLDVVRGALMALPRRYWGFTPGVPMTTDERDALRAALMARMAALRKGAE